MIESKKNKNIGGFSWFEWLIAWRYLKSKRKDGGISVIAWYALVGVTLGVGTLIVVQAVMIGFREEFTDKIVGVNPHIVVSSSQYDPKLQKSKLIENFEEIVKNLKLNEGTLNVAPVIKGQVLGSNLRKNVGLEVYGYKPVDFSLIPLIKDPEFSAGSIQAFKNGVAIGRGVAKVLNLRIGDNITLLSPNGVSTAFGTAPRSSTFEIKYIFGVGRYDIDNTRIYMPLKAAQGFFNKEIGVDQIDIIVSDPSRVEFYRGPVKNKLDKDFMMWTWKDASGAFLSALDVERRVMFIILSLVILIAALNIISGLVMLVKNKTRDIAILRTIGFSQASIMRIFFICGSLIGILGTIFGVIWGCLFAYFIHDIQLLIEFLSGGSIWNSEIRFLSQVPSRLRLQDIGLAITISLGISFLITVIPARNAAKINPVEAIRNE